MQHELSSPRSSSNVMRYEMPILAVAGAVEVLALYNLIIRLADAGDTTALLAGAICVILVFAAVLHFAWTGADLLRLGAIAFVVSLVLGALTYRVFARIAGTGEPSDADRTRVLFWAASLGTFAYVAGPFLQIFQRTGRLDFPYKALFTHSWANFHIAGVGLLFLGAAWVVLGLWAALFAMIGIDVFKRLFTWGPFAASVSGAALAYGIAFAVKRADLILTLRGVTLGVMRLLLPPVALVALAFLNQRVMK